MAKCGNCGALLAPQASWCLNCLWSVPGVEEPTPEVTEEETPEGRVAAVPAEPAESPAGSRPAARPLHATAFARSFDKPTYSRWKKGPTSFSPTVKIALTLVILAFAPVGGFSGFQVLFFVPYLPIATLLLWGIWRKQRVP